MTVVIAPLARCASGGPAYRDPAAGPEYRPSLQRTRDWVWYVYCGCYRSLGQVPFHLGPHRARRAEAVTAWNAEQARGVPQ